MDGTNDSRVSVDELAMILGQKEIQIYAQQKQLVAAQKRIAELTPKPPDPQPKQK